MATPRITIFDTTLRDGEQSPGCSMTEHEKLRMARQLERLRVDVIEAGFPVASEGDFAGVAAIAREIRSCRIAALARATQGDIETAWRAVGAAARPRLHVFLATSEIHLAYKLKITRDQALRQAAEAVQFARSLCPDVEFSPEDATRTDPAFLSAVIENVIEAGASTINLPDTVGYAVPGEMARMVAEACRIAAGKDVTVSVHCHNDLGLAVANSLAAVSAGARQVECTVNGIGERAGNCSLEEFVMALRVRPDAMPFETGIHTEQIHPSSSLLSEITGVAVQPNKAIVGRNAFAHEAGIHQDGVLKNPLTYEIMTPQSVGVPENRLVLGKHSGRNALGRRYEELGYSFSRRELDRVYKRFTAVADQVKEVSDAALHAIVREERAMGAILPGPAAHGAAATASH